ncbi:divalent metal cation transporter [Staphylococcus aureus]|uniref:divalent metal cation transporter n=1 Tax=Staphylococcus aureus TaxID=1280 RepID=UPI0006B52B67|nr:divalent metal cation transporter [Staphylococcus aureus]CUE04607.1 Mn2 and Fe2 transporter [Staphylococcus aureus]CUE17641.1 Mn2 and Fe2 transporter [Staphylococcus aureus]HCZ0227820.1 divalent metal cation transporter [Staphylococcus aureus]
MGRNLKLKKESDFEFTKNHKRLLLGSVFLMATSAIGPAFLTQTAVFTSQFFASFAFAILLSIIIDIGAQINIWRILVVTGLRGQEISNKVVPGLGTVISILIAFGGLAFNIGNIAGAGLGLNAIFGLDVKWGAAITAIFAILIFVSKSGQKIMDVVSMILGIVLFAAAMSSVIGSAYTSATFLKTLHKSLNERSNLIVIVFIVISTMIFLFIGKPISLLIIAGAINGWILPITLGAILIASKKKSIVGDYKHPNWMFIFGIVAVLVTILTGIFSFKEVLQLF